MSKICIRSAGGARAEVHHHGAHLTEWQTARGKQWLFLSKLADYSPGSSIRGGVPIIFPQFNAFGNGPRHGFARNLNWQLVPKACTDNHAQFLLESSDQTLKAWPSRFSAKFDCTTTDQSLHMSLHVLNTDSSPIEFTAALHTYFLVDDLSSSSIEGLNNLAYWDNNGAPFNTRSVARNTELHFKGAIDRVYFQYQKALLLHTESGTLHIQHNGFNDIVVWNPGPEAAASMPDMAGDEHNKMLCIEAAQIDEPIVLQPGESWTGEQILHDHS